MPKLLFVFQPPVFGGPQNQLLRLHRPLLERGWDSVAVVPSEPGSGADRLQSAGVPIARMPMHRLRRTLDPRLHVDYLTQVRAEVHELARIARSECADIVQAHGLVNLHAPMAAHMSKVPLVWQLLDSRSPRPVRAALMPILAATSSMVMATGQSILRSHPGWQLVKRKAVNYFPPVDVNLFSPGPTKVRSELGIPLDSLLIGTLGNINPQKGHEWLIDAVSQLRRRHELDIRGIIFGAHTPTHAAYERFLRRRIRRLGISEAMTIVDPGACPHLCLRALDVFCLTSIERSEGIPTAMLEAMATGLPIVATGVGSVSEVLEPQCGRIVPPRALKDLMKAISDLAVNEDLRRAMGALGRAKAVHSYALDSCVDTHVKVYERVLRNN